jgi:selenocysteine lyase/cysteine desulfurase
VLARLLHAHGAWCCADYAAGGPYLAIDMAESTPGAEDQCDALFLSPHKFVGGPGASGVLVADRRLFRRAVPVVPGGGTVAYVTADHHRYVADIERREEAGTPNIIGDIRAGLVLRLKSDIGAAAIAAAEHAMVARVLAAWRDEPNIALLGSPTADRLAVFSFNIRAGAGLLHPNLVVALLNDLFGIQARGGCSCAGPYGHDLLAIDGEHARAYETLVANGLPIFRPGWVRLSCNWFFSEAEVEAIIAAVAFIARRGADFLALYRPDPRSGRWLCRSETTAARYGFDDLCAWRVAPPAQKLAAPDVAGALAEAERLADKAGALACPSCPGELDDPARWFAVTRAA